MKGLVAEAGFFGLSVLFGLVLSQSGAADFEQIQQMFLFESFQLYGIIGTAVAVVAPGLLLLKRYGKTATGAPIAIKPKPLHRGNLVGGLLFGVGWAVTGMCPGPILVNLGEGKLFAVFALLGTLLGTTVLGLGYAGFSRWLGLPKLSPGDG